MKAPIYGKDKILLFRLLSKASTEAAGKLALQVEHTWNYERNQESKQTKDGAITLSSGLEVTLELNAVSTRDALNTTLKNAVIKNEKLEVWEVDISATPTGGKYPAIYAQGNLESWEVPDNVEEAEEITTTMRIDGIPQEGQATLTPEQLAEISAAYPFTDTAKTTG